ncbi:hypothetical protein BV898_08964 [Hypsibius exemplaris]|uniref:G-protein coupled receptors family 1 profile domain-containing protein n=1 Tax=Hypsibius exemplaris TaxID=2072580 RepID=A0A1W0WP52_HYPEX|nr:hypothetical protein BV898_08964 [Hypsibius exemplaris]
MNFPQISYNQSTSFFNSSSPLPPGLGLMLLYPYKPAIAWASVSFVMALFGSINNLLLLAVTFRLRSLNQGSGYLLGSFFFGNFLLSAFTLPTAAVGVILGFHGGRRQISDFHCNILQPLSTTIFVALAWTDAALGVNRYIAICWPNLYPRFSTKATAYVTIILCWAVSFACMLPMTFGRYGSYRVIPRTNLCTVVYDGVSGQVLGQLGVYGPWCIIGASVLLVLRRAIALSWIRARRIRAMGMAANGRDFNSAQQRQIRRAVALGRVLFIAFLWNVLCQVPVSVVVQFFPYILAQYPMVVLMLKSSLAGVYVFIPLIFYATSDDYRRGSRALVMSVVGGASSAGVHPNDSTRY